MKRYDAERWIHSPFYGWQVWQTPSLLPHQITAHFEWASWTGLWQ